jgi:hypothetical protein
MRVFILLAAALLSACAQSSSIQQLVLTTPLGGGASIEQWIASHPHASVAERALAFDALCDGNTRTGRYRAAEEACTHEAAIAGHTIDLDRSIALRRALADIPPISVSGSIDTPLSYDWLGMAEFSVTTSGETTNWGIDTGAEISVVSESDAPRVGVRMLNAELAIHGSTAGTAPAKVGVVDLMRVAGVEIRNVPVLVLPDAALTPAPGHPLPPVFGAPIVYAFGRVAFLDHGRRLRLEPGASTPLPGRLTWNPSGVAIDVMIGNGILRGQLDTGANNTELNSSTRSLLSSQQRAALVPHTTTVVGVGGALSRQVWSTPSLDIVASGATCRISNVRFGEETGDGAQGRIGVDLMQACRSITLDYTTLTYAAEGDLH